MWEDVHTRLRTQRNTYNSIFRTIVCRPHEAFSNEKQLWQPVRYTLVKSCGEGTWHEFVETLDGLSSEEAMDDMLDGLDCSCQRPKPRLQSCGTSTRSRKHDWQPWTFLPPDLLKPGRGDLARESSARGSAKIEALL